MQLVNSKTKVCFKCKTEKSHNCFYSSKNSLTLHPYCKICTSDVNKNCYRLKKLNKKNKSFEIKKLTAKIENLQKKMNVFWIAQDLKLSKKMIKKMIRNIKNIEKSQYFYKRRIEILREQLKE